MQTHLKFRITFKLFEVVGIAVVATALYFVTAVAAHRAGSGPGAPQEPQPSTVAASAVAPPR